MGNQGNFFFLRCVNIAAAVSKLGIEEWRGVFAWAFLLGNLASSAGLGRTLDVLAGHARLGGKHPIKNTSPAAGDTHLMWAGNYRSKN